MNGMLKTAAIIATWVVASTSYATIVTQTASVDTGLRVGAPTTNFEAEEGLTQGDYVSPSSAYRSLIQFDVSAIPNDATVNSAVLKLQNRDVGVNNGDGVVNVYRVTGAWNESQATWNERLTGAAWTAAGGDYAAGSYATATLHPYQTAGAEVYQISVTTLVQQWVAGTYVNNGMLLISDSENANQFKLFAFESTESSVSGAVLPQLVIDYTPVPEPAAMSVMGLAVAALARRRRR